jgi:hypothetical protein
MRFAGLLALGLALPGCYSPIQPGCAFSCAADGLCPAGYSCGGDGVCHRDDGEGTCQIPAQVDAARDAEADVPVQVQDGGQDGGDASADATD